MFSVFVCLIAAFLSGRVLFAVPVGQLVPELGEAGAVGDDPLHDLAGFTIA